MSEYISGGDSVILIRARDQRVSQTCKDIVVHYAIWLRTQKEEFLDSA